MARHGSPARTRPVRGPTGQPGASCGHLAAWMKVISMPAPAKAFCYDLGVRRNASKRPEWTRKKSHQMSDALVNYIGLKGEWAAAEALSEIGLLGSGIDTRIHSDGDDGYDLVLSDGRKVAVKFNHRRNGYLVFERESDFPASTPLALLVFGECRSQIDCRCTDMERTDRLTIAGWIGHDEFWSKATCSNWGLGVRWWVAPPLSDLALLKEPLPFLGDGRALFLCGNCKERYPMLESDLCVWCAQAKERRA